jgi:hypothetical protein
MPARADAFPVVGGGCTGRAHRCKAKQRRRGKTAPTFVSTFTVVRFLDGVEREGDRISLVTMAARCFFHHRARKNRRWWPVTELLPQFSQGRSGALERDLADRLSPGRSGMTPVVHGFTDALLSCTLDYGVL